MLKFAFTKIRKLFFETNFTLKATDAERKAWLTEIKFSAPNVKPIKHYNVL